MRGDYGEDPPISSVLLADKRVCARKEHICTSCRRPISAGQTYRRRFGLVDGQPYTDKMCIECEGENLW